MALFCYYQVSTGERFVSPEHGLDENPDIRRDYRAENVNTEGAVALLKSEREWAGDPSDFVMTRTDAERKAVQNLAARGETKTSIGERDIRREADNVVSEWNNTHTAEKTIGSDKHRPRTSDNRFAKPA